MNQFPEIKHHLFFISHTSDFNVLTWLDCYMKKTISISYIMFKWDWNRKISLYDIWSMSSYKFGVFGSITRTGIVGVLRIKIPNCLNCVVSSTNNVTKCLWQWKCSQLLNGPIINGIFTVMFKNEVCRPQTKDRHGKLSCHCGILWDMEGMLEPVLHVWLISQVDRKYVNVSNVAAAF